jgi:chitodextrinase
VADIDTGVDRNHEDLQGQMWVNTAETPDNGVDDDGNGYVDDYHGWDWVNHDNDPMDDHGHGTHTVGTIAGVGNNGKGVVGVNWTSKIMALKFLNASGNGGLDDGAAALQYAADMGAKVSSNSWGCSCQSILSEDAVKYEHDRGMVVAAAAGNSNADALNHSPSSADHAVTVAASDYNDAKASFSNWGEKIDVAAPGVETLSLKAATSPMCTSRPERIVGTNYCKVSGTSMATPHVAGLAALLLAKNPNLTNEEIRQILRTGADDLGTAGKDRDYGYGRINAAGSMNLSATHPLTPVITSPRSRTAPVSSFLEIRGSVLGPNFANYKVEMGVGRSPSSWTTLNTSTNQVINGVLATANNLGSLPEGSQIIFRLTATDTTGKIYQFQVHDITIDNFETIITSPATSVFGNTVDVIGTAQTKNGVIFGNYKLEYGAGTYPSSWLASGITLTNSGNQPVAGGDLGTWDTSSLTNDAVYTLRLTVTSSSGESDQAKVQIRVDKEVLSGWPKDLGVGWIYSVPAVADLNNDGQEEIFVAPVNQQKIFAFKKDGTNLAGWPVTLPLYIPTTNSLVISDISGDGKKEVIVRTGTYIDVIGYDGNSYPGWPQRIDYFTGSPAAGDLDGDGSSEIVILSQFGSTLQVYALNGDGSIVSGFPKTVFENGTAQTGSYKNYDTHLVDIDDDKKLEMIIHPRIQNVDTVYVLDYQGDRLPGWPKTITADFEVEIDRTLAGDITGDGMAEIIVYYSKQGASGEDTYITVFDANGNELPNYPQWAARSVGRMGPALGDATDDGTLDIVIPNYGDGGYAFKCSPSVFTKDGLVSHPYCYYSHDALPAIVDFNGNGEPNVIASGGHNIHVLSKYYDVEGKLGWEKIWEKSPGNTDIQPIVSDLDNNGKWEIIAVVKLDQSSAIFVWEPEGADNSSANGKSWSQYLGDESHTGTYPVGTSTPPPADTTPPSSTITNPTDNSQVSGTVNVTADAIDNVGVTKVEFYVDDVLKSTDTSSPYSYSWDSTSVSNGIYVIKAKAYDAAGNVGSAEVSVTVGNGDTQPPSTPTNLSATDTSHSKVDLSWTASTDNVGVTGYWVVRDGVTIANVTLGTSYSDTTVSPSTAYEYQVIAYDAAGNLSPPSNVATVTTPSVPDTQAPTVPTGVSATAVSSSQINLSWNASSDNVGVVGYEVYRDMKYIERGVE